MPRRDVATNGRACKPARSLSYKGCWTCRKRRVKCDERPVVCRICEAANLPCAGYCVRLSWDVGQHPGRQKPRTSRCQIRPDVGQLLTEDEVSRILFQIDRSAARFTTTTMGPFSVWNFHTNPHLDFTTSDMSLEAIDTEERTTSHGLQGDAAGIAQAASRYPIRVLDDGRGSDSIDLIEVFNDSTIPVAEDSNTGSETASSEIEFVTRPSDQLEYIVRQNLVTSNHNASSTEWIGEPPRQSEDEDEGDLAADHWCYSSLEFHDIVQLPAQSMGSDLQTSHSSNQLTHISCRSRATPKSCPKIGSPLLGYNLAMNLAERTTADLLIHHYMSHTVHVMQPVIHQNSPFQTIYLPLAIEGASKMAPTMSLQRHYPPSVAVFHSLLCVAAIHLQGAQADGEELHHMACLHKQRALIALRSALTSQSSSYRDMMTAILSMVTVDIANGGTTDHWVHLEACEQLQASRHYPRRLSRDTQRLVGICRMLDLFAHTALPLPTTSPSFNGDTFLGEIEFNYLESSVEFIYGITTSLARLIHKIHRLTLRLSSSLDEELPETLLEACETLGDELASWTIESELFSALDPTQGQTFQIARAQARAFYYAALIYYHRSVQKCDRKHLHTEQQAVIAAMNEAEDLKVASGEVDCLSAPITWPAFTASCEAVGEDREQWRKWWGRAQKYQMGNYNKQREIVYSVWEALDREIDASADWRNTIALMNVRIIPV